MSNEDKCFHLFYYGEDRLWEHKSFMLEKNLNAFW